MSVPPAPTSLLSLPNELLVKIARDVAPDGGRKAGNFRLANRGLGRLIAQVTWASVVLPITDLDALDEFANELSYDRTGNTSLITSLRYNRPARQLRLVVSAIKGLPSLRRLHLAGTGPKAGLFVPLHDLLGTWNTLEALQLDYVDLTSIWEMRTWAPNVSSLGMVGCRSSHAPFRTDATCKPSNPFSLKLAGASKLFRDSPPTDPAASFIVRLLNWISLGPLTTLCLPVIGTFFAPDVLASLSLPSVQTLVIDVDPTSLTATDQDLLSPGDTSNYIQLLRFLKLAALPSLSTLHLQGWLNVTGVAKLGLIPISDLPAESLTVYALLGFLRTTTVVELKLENSVGHAESDVQCIFTRDGEGDWTSRLARFW
ncbi:hypothetical protein RQP46_001609 [Phenoliferia psychrophenolica]